jgi:hypothetical protein
MPSHLARLWRALRPGGLLYIGLKDGDGERLDGLGRFYVYYRRADLLGLLDDAGFVELDVVAGPVEPGYDGVPYGSLHAYGRRPA